MSSYVHGSRMSYNDYLQAKSFVDDVRWDISQTNLNLVATNETLQKYGVRLEQSIEQGFGDVQEGMERGFTELSGRLDDVDRTLVEGFITLHCDLLSIESSVQDLSAKFEWGFSQLLISLGTANESLAALVKLAQTPEQTWSLEQYGIALTAFRRGLFREALDYVERAINGHQGHTGYSIEHRFHSLLGVIRLGSFENNAPEIVDREKAYAAFLSAARYAMHDHQQDAARALCGAARAAYCLGRFDASESHASEALRLTPRLGEAAFHLAKTFLHGGNTKRGLPALAWALRLDPLYSLKAFDDPDFTRHESAVRRLLEDMREELAGECRKQIAGSLTFFRLGTERLEAIARHPVALANVPADARNYQWFQVEEAKAVELATTAKNLIAKKRYLDTVSAAATCREILMVAAAAVDKVGAFLRSIQAHLTGAPDRLIAAFLRSKGHGAQAGSPEDRAGVALRLILLGILLCALIFGFLQIFLFDMPVLLLAFLVMFVIVAFLSKPLTRTFAKQIAKSRARRDAFLRAAAPVACKDAIGELMRFRDSTAEKYAALQKKLDELKGTAAAFADQRPQPPT